MKIFKLHDVNAWGFAPLVVMSLNLKLTGEKKIFLAVSMKQIRFMSG